MKALISAYTCLPNRGSEPGAGFALVKAAAETAECWVLTRTENVPALTASDEFRHAANPIHIVGFEAPDRILRVKNKLDARRFYYSVWQRVAAQKALELHRQVRFDLAHHATFSAYWLPIGLFALDVPLVLGPLSGGTTTPLPLLRYLGSVGLLQDATRLFASRTSTLVRKRAFRTNASVLLAQNEQMRQYAERNLIARSTPVLVHPHASDPQIDLPTAPAVRKDEVVSVGRLLPWKGGALALKAFAAARLPSTTLSFIGEGRDLPRLARLAEHMGISTQVKFAGPLPRPEVLRRMQTAAAMLFPSLHDSAGFVVSEALSIGLPVVCLDHGGPGALTRLWSGSPSAAVPVDKPGLIVQRLADELHRFVESPAPIPRALIQPDKNLSEAIRWAYNKAAGKGRVG